LAVKRGRRGKKAERAKAKENPGPEGDAVEARPETQVCPVCGELMDLDATKCEACGHDLKGEAPKKDEEKSKPKKTPKGKPKVEEKKEAPKGGKGKEEKPKDEKKEAPPAAMKPKKSPRDTEDQALAKWLSGEAGENALQVWLGKTPDAAAPAQTKATPAASSETKDYALKMWLTGEAGGDALDEWLTEEGAPPEMPAGELDEQLAQRDAVIKKMESEIKTREKEIKELKTELEAFKKSLRDKLKKLKTKDFDPLKLITETAELNKTLQGEIKMRKELEQEIEKVKKGSIAVIKYVKAQQMKIREKEMKKLRGQLKKTTEDEERLKKIIEEKEKRFAELEKSLSAKIDDLPTEMKKLKQKEMELIKKESDISGKEQQLVSHAKELQEKEALASTSDSASDEELRNRFQAELQEKESDYLKRESGLKKRIIELEEEVQKAKIDEKLEKEALERRGKSEGEISKDLKDKEKILASKEKSIILRETEIERLKEELKYKTDEIKKLKEPLAYKEDEILRREEDMLYREKLLIAEKRKLETAKKEGGGVHEVELKRRLEELQAKISEKEADIIKKEKYLHAKSEELRVREQGLIEEEIESREEERTLELQVEKIKTGNPRLDDLLFGGIPFGVNVLVYGQAFIGKEIVVNQFIAEGLKKGIPAIWVITDKSPSDIREEMEFVVSGYQEYERLDLVRYVDAYSKSMGEETEEAHTIYIDQPTNHEAILKSVEGLAKELMKKHKYYRLAFRSISTLIAYLDMNIAYRFLQPFAGRRKKDKAVAMYVIEKGMHSETDIQMVGSIMDGAVEFKLEQLQTFLCVKGIGDVQSRAWIRYTHSKKGVSIGSFALGHIR
jgi:KaiC/GvpD/RAD55 family RecA-like ATPase